MSSLCFLPIDAGSSNVLNNQNLYKIFNAFFFSGQDISTDDRSYLMHLINSMDVKSSCAFFYPRLIPMVGSSLLSLLPSFRIGGGHEYNG